MKPKALVIDNDPSSRTLLLDILGGDLDVATVSSASEGLEMLFRIKELSLVLLDLVLPDMGGIDILRRIRGNEKTRSLNTVIVTASDDHDLTVKCANLNVQGYFQKPVEIKALKEKILALCGAAGMIKYKTLKELWGSEYRHRLKSVSITIRCALDYIEDNYRKACDREDIASHLDICPDYLSRLFQSECGSRLMEYVALCKVRHSKETILINPRIKVKELARAVGIPDADYFCKTFKKLTGCTPRQFREKSLDSSPFR